MLPIIVPHFPPLVAGISNEIVAIMNENLFHSFMVADQVAPRRMPVNT